MAGRNVQGMAPQNYGQLNQANSNKAISQARLDKKQEALFKAISNVVQASAKDIYGDVTDKKTRYVVDLILKRIEGLFAAEGISSEQIQEVVSQAVKELSTTSVSKEWLEKLSKDIADKTIKLDGIEQKLESNAQKIAELKTLFGQQTTSTPQAEVGKTLKQDAFSKHTTFSKMLTTLGIDQVKNFAKLTGIVKAFHTDISSAMKASQQINVGNMADIQKKIAATQDSSMQVAKQVAQLQENVTDAIDAQQQLFFKNFEFSFKSMFTSAMKGMWTLAKFPFQMAWKLVKGPLEALIVNPLKKTIAFAKDLVTAPFKFLTDTVSAIFKGLTKGTFNILAGFLSTPAGMFALGYGLGFIWKRWVQPFWNKVVGFWDEYVSPILAPFKKWFDGNMTFTDALSASWNKLKDTVWTSWLKPKWDKFAEDHPILAWAAELTKEHPLAVGLTAWLGWNLKGWLAKQSFIGILKGLKWLTLKSTQMLFGGLGKLFGISGVGLGAGMAAAMVGTFYGMWQDAAKEKNKVQEALVNGGEVKGLFGAKSITNGMVQSQLADPDAIHNLFDQMAQGEFDKRIQGYMTGDKKLEGIVNDVLANATNKVNTRAQIQNSQNLATIMALLSTATPMQAKTILEQLEAYDGTKSSELVAMLKAKANDAFNMDTYMSNPKFASALQSIREASDDKLISKVLSMKNYNYEEAYSEIDSAAKQLFGVLKSGGQAISKETMLQAIDGAIEVARSEKHGEKTAEALEKLRADMASGNKDVIELLTMLINKQVPPAQNNVAIFEQQGKQELTGVR